MKTVLITGGSSGIGLALGWELGRRGWRVALAARREELLEQHAAEMRNEGLEAMAVACDVSELRSVTSAVERVRQQWGEIDLAVANAGVAIRGKASKLDVEDAESVMRTNFFGTLYLYHATVPAMLERGSGQFVGIASMAGLRGLAGASMYSASKAAMQSFLESTRVELAPTGVRVITVNPGFVDTPIVSRNRFPMPLVISAEKAARIIANGIERNRRLIEFPLGTSIGMRILAALPIPIYDRLSRILLRVRRRDG